MYSNRIRMLKIFIYKLCELFVLIACYEKCLGESSHVILKHVTVLMIVMLINYIVDSRLFNL